MTNTTLLRVAEYYTYKNFINSCKDKEYSEDLVLHTHHIILRCFGGTDEKSNLVKLSVEDHINAHLLFGKCFDENSYEENANLKAARILNNKSIKDKETLRKISLAFSGENNPFYGKKHTEETKSILKKATTENRKGVDYITLYGEEQAKIEKQKRSDANKKVWENRSQDKRDTISLAISKGTKGKIPWNKGKGKKISVDGNVFESITLACEHYKLSKFLLEKNYNVIYL